MAKTAGGRFPHAWRRGVYAAIARRRDMRSFISDPIPQRVLARLLAAAHRAGSVGLMQPWDFIVIRDPAVKRRIKQLFLAANAAAAQVHAADRRRRYDGLKLEGIEEAPVNLCVTCDPDRKGPHVLGRHSMPETALFSTCCAIQNLWLAARAEGIGVGWVSILDPAELRQALGIPAAVRPVAYLCMGYVAGFPRRPVLEQVGWEKRLPLDEILHLDRWGNRRRGIQ